MDLHSLVSGVRDYTQKHLPQYIEELRELCAIDSDSHYKPGLDLMAVKLGARMRKLGMQVNIVEREACGNDLTGSMHGEGSGNVLLLGHIDTVYPVGTAGERPLRIEGDIALGPGVCDMKGCILAAIYAIEALLAMGTRPFAELRFLCVSDEEILYRHSIDLIEAMCRNCQGALVLEAARANGDIVSSRKGNSGYTLVARGRSAHAGVEPEKGLNAITEIAHQVLQFQSLNGWREGITINPGLISGGTALNVVPEHAQARFDLRYLHSNDRNETEQRWQEMMKQKLVPGVDLTLEVSPDAKEPMVSTPVSLKLAGAAQEIAGFLGFPLNHVSTGGSSDGSYVSHFGVPVLDGLGPIGGLDHSPGEYLLLSSVASRSALLGGLLAIIGSQNMHE
ncbi:MAG TPA: M20 family metallopeptidase [Ktedonobacteraceae bacterium]|nr:M20 family metallopeptidase [Ktedonobacteraceae bacterium]